MLLLLHCQMQARELGVLNKWKNVLLWDECQPALATRQVTSSQSTVPRSPTPCDEATLGSESTGAVSEQFPKLHRASSF